MQKRESSNKNKSPQEAIVIGSLDQLQKLVDAPCKCEFELDGQLISLPVKRMTALVEEQRREILRKPQPPYIEARKEYDMTATLYIKARDEAEKKARALVVYSCCPAVAEKKPGLTNIDEITRFVQSLLSENILEAIALAALAGGLNVEVARRANFTSPPGLDE